MNFFKTTLKVHKYNFNVLKRVYFIEKNDDEHDDGGFWV